jgi:hypothetical protein
MLGQVKNEYILPPTTWLAAVSAIYMPSAPTPVITSIITFV